MLFKMFKQIQKHFLHPNASYQPINMVLQDVNSSRFVNHWQMDTEAVFLYCCQTALVARPIQILMARQQVI